MCQISIALKYFRSLISTGQCTMYVFVISPDFLCVCHFRVSSAEATGVCAPCQAMNPMLYGTHFRHKDYCNLRALVGWFWFLCLFGFFFFFLMCLVSQAIEGFHPRHPSCIYSRDGSLSIQIPISYKFMAHKLA